MQSLLQPARLEATVALSCISQPCYLHQFTPHPPPLLGCKWHLWICITPSILSHDLQTIASCHFHLPTNRRAASQTQPSATESRDDPADCSFLHRPLCTQIRVNACTHTTSRPQSFLWQRIPHRLLHLMAPWCIGFFWDTSTSVHIQYHINFPAFGMQKSKLIQELVMANWEMRL